MSTPQQPELARSRKTPAQDQDAVAGIVEGQRAPGDDAPRGPVPADNQPGHHPAEEQDKPDLDAFAQKLGTVEPSERSDPPAERDVSTGPAQAGRDVRPVVAGGVVIVAGIAAMVRGRRRRSRRSRS